MHQKTVNAEIEGDERYRETRKVTLIGSVVDLLLGIVKIIVGYLGSSQALIADGVHSFSDLVTDFMVLFAAKHAYREADDEHPYGHARIETVMTVALGLALIIIGIGIGIDAIRRLYHTDMLLHPGYLALSVAALSVLLKELIYHYTMRVAIKLRSNILRANAWHSRSDAISSLIVFVGVLGSMAGLEYLDAIAAVGVAYMIAKIGWDFAWQSIRELVDTALDEERVEAIRNTIRNVGGVQDLHLLRTRRMGADALVDVHIQVEPRLSVSEGHQISEVVRSRVIHEVAEVSDVLVHIDPEDDLKILACKNLPLRNELEQRMRAAWEKIPVSKSIEGITLHYLSGKVHVDISLPLSVAQTLDEANQIQESLRAALSGIPELGGVKIHYH